MRIKWASRLPELREMFPQSLGFIPKECVNEYHGNDSLGFSSHGWWETIPHLVITPSWLRPKRFFLEDQFLLCLILTLDIIPKQKTWMPKCKLYKCSFRKCLGLSMRIYVCWSKIWTILFFHHLIICLFCHWIFCLVRPPFLYSNIK